MDGCVFLLTQSRQLPSEMEVKALVSKIDDMSRTGFGCDKKSGTEFYT